MNNFVFKTKAAKLHELLNILFLHIGSIILTKTPQKPEYSLKKRMLQTTQLKILSYLSQMLIQSNFQ